MQPKDCKIRANKQLTKMKCNTREVSKSIILFRGQKSLYKLQSDVVETLNKLTIVLCVRSREIYVAASQQDKVDHQLGR